MRTFVAYGASWEGFCSFWLCLQIRFDKFVKKKKTKKKRDEIKAASSFSFIQISKISNIIWNESDLIFIRRQTLTVHGLWARKVCVLYLEDIHLK